MQITETYRPNTLPFPTEERVGNVAFYELDPAHHPGQLLPLQVIVCVKLTRLDRNSEPEMVQYTWCPIQGGLPITETPWVRVIRGRTLVAVG